MASKEGSNPNPNSEVLTLVQAEDKMPNKTTKTETLLTI